MIVEGAADGTTVSWRETQPVRRVAAASPAVTAKIIGFSAIAVTSGIFHPEVQQLRCQRVRSEWRRVSRSVLKALDQVRRLD